MFVLRSSISVQVSETGWFFDTFAKICMCKQIFEFLRNLLWTLSSKTKTNKKKNGRGNKDANKFLSFSETCFEQLFFKKGNKDEN